MLGCRHAASQQLEHSARPEFCVGSADYALDLSAVGRIVGKWRSWLGSHGTTALRHELIRRKVVPCEPKPGRAWQLPRQSTPWRMS
jgi:hypothetical protein